MPAPGSMKRSLWGAAEAVTVGRRLADRPRRLGGRRDGERQSGHVPGGAHAGSTCRRRAPPRCGGQGRVHQCRPGTQAAPALEVPQALGRAYDDHRCRAKAFRAQDRSTWSRKRPARRAGPVGTTVANGLVDDQPHGSGRFSQSCVSPLTVRPTRLLQLLEGIPVTDVYEAAGRPEVERGGACNRRAKVEVGPVRRRLPALRVDRSELLGAVGGPRSGWGPAHRARAA